MNRLVLACVLMFIFCLSVSIGVAFGMEYQGSATPQWWGFAALAWVAIAMWCWEDKP